jgi:transposase
VSKVRRKFDKEFKLAAVRMVTEDKLSRVEVARRLGVNPTQIRQWVQEIISPFTCGDVATDNQTK